MDDRSSFVSIYATDNNKVIIYLVDGVMLVAPRIAAKIMGGETKFAKLSTASHIKVSATKVGKQKPRDRTLVSLVGLLKNHRGKSKANTRYIKKIGKMMNVLMNRAEKMFSVIDQQFVNYIISKYDAIYKSHGKISYGKLKMIVEQFNEFSIFDLSDDDKYNLYKIIDSHRSIPEWAESAKSTEGILSRSLKDACECKKSDPVSTRGVNEEIPPLYIDEFGAPNHPHLPMPQATDDNGKLWPFDIKLNNKYYNNMIPVDDFLAGLHKEFSFDPGETLYNMRDVGLKKNISNALHTYRLIVVVLICIYVAMITLPSK